MFDPQPHLIKLPRKVKDRATGHYTTVYEDYLEVKWRLCWFRDRYPHGVLTTEEVCVDLERGYARYRCVVEDGQGGKATGYGTETAADFADYAERAETRAIGRALAALGIGTQFVGQDLTEGEHVADAPVASPNGHPVAPVTQPAGGPVHGDTPDGFHTHNIENSANGDAPEGCSIARTELHMKHSSNGDTPPPTVIPTVADLPTSIPVGLQLPCAEALIVDLRPPQLSLLIGKVGLRALADKTLEPLHVALLAERARRLSNGRKEVIVSEADANGT